MRACLVEVEKDCNIRVQIDGHLSFSCKSKHHSSFPGAQAIAIGIHGRVALPSVDIYIYIVLRNVRICTALPQAKLCSQEWVNIVLAPGIWSKCFSHLFENVVRKSISMHARRSTGTANRKRYSHSNDRCGQYVGSVIRGVQRPATKHAHGASLQIDHESVGLAS
jgi:hypothetical protein